MSFRIVVAPYGACRFHLSKLNCRVGYRLMARTVAAAGESGGVAFLLLERVGTIYFGGTAPGYLGGRGGVGGEGVALPLPGGSDTFLDATNSMDIRIWVAPFGACRVPR